MQMRVCKKKRCVPRGPGIRKPSVISEGQISIGTEIGGTSICAETGILETIQSRSMPNHALEYFVKRSLYFLGTSFLFESYFLISTLLRLKELLIYMVQKKNRFTLMVDATFFTPMVQVHLLSHFRQNEVKRS